MSGPLPPSFLFIQPARCSTCNSSDHMRLVNRHFTPNNALQCDTCFVAACPAHWKRSADQEEMETRPLHALLRRNYCQLTRAPYKHTELCMFFVPLLRDNVQLLQSACFRFYCNKQEALCAYEFGQEERNWSDFFVTYASVEQNVKDDIRPFFKIKRRLF